MQIEKESKNYKWMMLGLLTLTYFLMHGSRQIFNSSLPDIKHCLPGTTDAEWGLTRTVFLFAYGLVVPFAGIAADMLRRKWVLVLGVLLFSVGVFCTGYVDGFVGMLVMYGLMNGIGQCMIPASASSLIAQYHHETRSTALSIYQSGLYFGVILSSVLAGVLSGFAVDGWRWAFWGFGGFGVVWVLVLVIFLRDTPPLHCLHSEHHHHGVEHGLTVRPSFRDACLAMVSKPTAICLTLAFGMLVFGSNCFRTFLPLFLRQGAVEGGFGLSSASAAFHGVFWFYIGSFLGIAAGARLSDRLVHRFPAIRINVMWIGMLISAPTMAAMVYMPNLWLCCLMTFFFGIGGGLFDCSICAGLFEVVAPHFRSAAMGVYLCGAFIIGCPATAVLGYVGQHFGYQHGIALMAGTYLIGALIILFARLVFFHRDRIHLEEVRANV